MKISFFLVIPLMLLCGAATKGKVTDKEFQKILNEYVFVSDFEQKPPETKVSSEVFWRYPLKIPRTTFLPHLEVQDLDQLVEVMPGSGRAIEHINLGRKLLLEGQFQEARKVWTAGRTSYKFDAAQNRRLDFYLAVTYLLAAKKMLEESGGDYMEKKTKGLFANTSSFLSLAFIARKAQVDTHIDKYAPEWLYNLASIYHTYEREDAAFGIAQEALEFLTRTGRKELRAEFRRLMTEAHIRNHTYLEALQEIDTGIRQDPDPRMASLFFSRAADIYFDLNNYDLAEDNYALSSRISEEQKAFSPAQMILRGESLFWLGKFTESYSQLRVALEGLESRDQITKLSPDYASYGKLRQADCLLAESARQKDTAKKQELRERAKLAYFQVTREYSGTHPAHIADIRYACLELPEYGGNNVKHAREILEAAKTEDLPASLVELSWACQVASYTQRERTDGMVNRVRDFYAKYPESEFLQGLIEPVREVQAQKFEIEFKDSYYRGLDFFEKNRRNLFPKISQEFAIRLFKAYIAINASTKAAEFWPQAQKSDTDDLDKIRQAVFLTEMSEAEPKKASWRQQRNKYAQMLTKHKWTLEPNGRAKLHLARLQNSKSADIHLPWIYQLIETWASMDVNSVCDSHYPLLSNLLEKKSQEFRKKKLAESIDRILNKHFSTIVSKDATCAQSLVDLENRIFGKHYDMLYTRYEKRSHWPLDPIVLAQYLYMAEGLEAMGKKQTARSLWTLLATKAPADAPEAKLAKIRLDPYRTETESIWQ